MPTSAALRTASLFLLLLLITVISAPPATAGTISLAWDPVSAPDLAGYRVYWGASPTSYNQSLDVGNLTQATIPSLTDCTNWYVAVKAYDSAGNLSTAYSNEISGWARPVVSTTSPTSAERGRTLNLTLTGSNFRSGATVKFANTGITVNSVTVSSCSQIVVGVTVGVTAALGATNVSVVNPDTTIGTGANLFTVTAVVPPLVLSTNPTDGATGVSVAVHPSATFSEAMSPASITTATVRLLDASSSPVAQAAGSPSLSGDGLTATITPAASLTLGQTFRIQVVGGASGVKDAANNAMAVTFTQPVGFQTAGDATDPVISAVAASQIGSTTTRITWTTNEVADSLVFFRKSGQTGYQESALDATDVTSHTVDLAGLTPATTYQYNVQSTDPAGNSSTSSPNLSFTTASSSQSYLQFEAESGTLTSPVRTQSGAGAFAQGWIDTPSGTAAGTSGSPAGTAVYGFNVPAAGTWYLWVRMYAPAAVTSDSWFESVDAASRQAVVAPTTGSWVWVEGRSYVLTAGLHSLELGGRDAQTRADRVLLTNDAAFAPSEQPVDDQTPTGAVSGFSATGATGQITLNWTNPTGSDFQKTVVRYRTDGRFPTSPVDGFLATEEAASPGSADSFVHAGLSNGTTYHYAAFALDDSGNVAVPATTTGIPSDVTAPGNVSNVRRIDTEP